VNDLTARGCRNRARGGQDDRRAAVGHRAEWERNGQRQQHRGTRSEGPRTQLPQPVGELSLGSGRIIVSEIELPNNLVNLDKVNERQYNAAMRASPNLSLAEILPRPVGVSIVAAERPQRVLLAERPQDDHVRPDRSHKVNLRESAPLLNTAADFPLHTDVEQPVQDFHL
jgi:hypothetical protein